MPFNPLEDSEDAKAERTRLGLPDTATAPALVGLDYDEAVQKGHEHMQLAKQAWAKVEGAHFSAQGVGNDIARATFLQTRALSFYQYAALVKPNS